jgi:hypothetical protein
MRRPSASLVPVLLATGWLHALFAPLLSPARALANRDVPLFHLPLRASWRWLAAAGPPVWNPWLNGGQPVLSNPSYAAFYPPSWLVLLVPPAYALNLLVLLHAAVAFAGAWRLARRLGAGRGAAALAALAYSGGGASLSLLSAFTLFCSMAWLPWLLGWGDAAMAAPAAGRTWVRPALLAGVALALQLVNGEPATVVLSALALLALAAVTARRRPAILLRALVPFVVAAGLAAVQLVPTWGRLAGSPRAGGVATRQATTWSTPPERVVELAFPRFFGDPARDQEGLYFGWHFHDRDYPYVTSIYPGLLLAVLGLSALVRLPVPRRGAWALAAAAGAFLALGRHNPLYETVRRHVPVLAVLRFPEKFALLTVAALVFAGALGWQRLLAERQAGRRQAADFPLALALVLLATAAALAVLLYATPRTASWFIRSHGGPRAGDLGIAHALSYLRGEAWAAVATAAAVALLLALCRARRPSARALSAAAVALLAADLWHYGHGLVRTLPAAAYREAPSLARALPAAAGRLYVEPAPDGSPDLVPRGGDPATAGTRAALARLEPYSGVLWHIPYALNEDYDLMLTEWGRLALTILHAEWRQPELAYRFLGAWNVSLVLRRRPPEEWAAAVARDPGALPVRPVVDPFVLPRYRFAPRASFHDSYGSALYVARSERYALDRHEHCVRTGAPPGTVTYAEPPQVLSLADEGGRIRLHYRGRSDAFFTVATTYDEGWRATLDGAALPVYPTAACQLGVALPAGEHRLLLAYRDPLLPLGAAVSLATLLAVLAAAFLPGRRDSAKSRGVVPAGSKGPLPLFG